MTKKKRQGDPGESSDSNGENEGSLPGCPHASKGVNVTEVRKKLREKLATECLDCSREAKKTGLLKEEKDAIGICARCGQCRCLSGSKHAEQHAKNCQTEPHDLSIDTQTFNIWCFKCEKLIPFQANKCLQEVYEVLRKKGKDAENAVITANSEPIAYHGTILLLPLPELPRVRGLANLGNTCFFNAVLQCLAQTPFLLPILKEMSEPGELFRLPGGEVQIGEEKENLEPLEGTLKEWGPLTASLAETLEELQSGAQTTYIPRKLRLLLQEKCPQFKGFGEHDSHELLRQLLETVRNEDHERYKSVILEKMNLKKKCLREQVTDQQTRVLRAYGRQAGDVLRPSQVFRGELVSTLQCQKCLHATDHIEHFLDLSLPVASDKPMHARRRVNSEESDSAPKLRRYMKRRIVNKNSPSESRNDKLALDASNGQSDADNEEEEEEQPKRVHEVNESGYSSEKPANGDSVCGSPSTASPTSAVVCNGQLEEDSVLLKNFNGVVDATKTDEIHNESNRVRHSPPRNLNLLKNEAIPLPPPLSFSMNDRLEGLSSSISELHMNTETSPESDISGSERRDGCEAPADTPLDSECAAENMECESPQEECDGARAMTPSNEHCEKPCPGATLAPREYATNGICSVVSCLNQFTAQELLTVNNKVGCEACTERKHGKGGKTIYTDASKQLLILNPPAILILHLKRFQVWKFSSRKNSEEVCFDPILDLAPFCSVKAMDTPTVRKDQKEVRYALYGVVQHSGSMHGGHYVAHVKVRAGLARNDPRWAFLPPGPSSTGFEESPESVLPETPPDAPPGQWYYVSDSHVSPVKENAVLSSEAYLLFYERIY